MMQTTGEFHHTQLEKIRKWPFDDSDACFRYMQSLWRWPEYLEIKRKYIYLSTGGWSGHEEAVGALQTNMMLWMMVWYSSRRGGHYIFTRQRCKSC
jgi:hypothetical protein